MECFWSVFKNEKQIKIEELIFTDEKKFQVFLDGIRMIPKEVNLVCSVNVENLKNETLVQCLAAYIKEVHVMGKLQLYLTKLQGGDNITLEKNETNLVNFKIIQPDNKALLLEMKG